MPDTMSGKITHAILRAIEESDKLPVEIARAAKIYPSQLSRLISGERSLSLEAAEKLCDELGIEIVLKRKPKSKKGRS
jgi:hypothetical protein